MQGHLLPRCHSKAFKGDRAENFKMVCNIILQVHVGYEIVDSQQGMS